MGNNRVHCPFKRRRPVQQHAAWPPPPTPIIFPSSSHAQEMKLIATVVLVATGGVPSHLQANPADGSRCVPQPTTATCFPAVRSPGPVPPRRASASTGSPAALLAAPTSDPHQFQIIGRDHQHYSGGLGNLPPNGVIWQDLREHWRGARSP